MSASPPIAVGSRRFDHPNIAVRREIARQLSGDGVEFGPGCHPLPTGPFVSRVRYCDFIDRDGYLERYPESAHEVEGFPAQIDFLLDFDKEWFVERIGKGTLDFVVASHVLEHLVNPVRFLEQCHELLRDGGLLYVGVPDKRRTFDADRERTPLADVVSRYRNNETELSDARIHEFVHRVMRPAKPVDFQTADGHRMTALLRDRTLHVNVWILDDLVELFAFLGRELAMPMELLDGICYEQEFILLFRKTDRRDAAERYPVTVARLCSDSYRYLLETRYLSRLEHLDDLTHRIGEVQNLVQLLKRLARTIPGAQWFERWIKRRLPP